MSVIMYLCVCSYVCKFMKKNLYFYETPIYFSNIYYLLINFIIECLLMDIHNFGEGIIIIKGFTKMGFTVMLVGSSIWIVII